MSDEFSYRLQGALGDGYSIERELGGAGMSRVFAAQEMALQRRVVIKVLPPDLAAGVNHERFRREIQVAAQLQHPHIVPLLAAGESGGLLWFTMPFIEGESLRAAIARRGRFPVRDVVRVLHDVTDALAYAHARGVVHRDIKPGNILTSGMHALVTDFGVAKALSAAIPSSNGGTTTGMAIGTPAYMAPEQLAADPAADHRMDIYAVGLLGYELLTGKSPFAGNSPQATLAAQLTQMPDALHRSLPEVPVVFSNIIMKCLEKDASKRFPSATALLAELDAMPMFGSGETPSHSARRSRRGPLVAVAAVVIAAVGLAFAQRNELRAMFAKDQPATSASSGGSASKGRGTGNNGAGRPGGNAALASAGTGGDTTATSGDAGVRTDTVYLYRDTTLSDAQKRTTLPMVITRAESVAIAEKFRQRQAADLPSAPASKPASGTNAAGAPRAATDAQTLAIKSLNDLLPITRDSLFAEMGRVFSDSITRVLKQMQLEIAAMPRTAIRLQDMSTDYEGFRPLISPPANGVSRVVIQPFQNGTGKRDLTKYTRLFVDSLRLALAGQKSVEVVDAEMTARAQDRSANVVAVGFSLRADYMVTGTLIQRGDSLVLLTTFSDVRRPGFTRRAETKMPVADPMRALPSTISSVNMWMDSAKVAPRSNQRGPGRGPDGRGNEARPGSVEAFTFEGRGGPRGTQTKSQSTFKPPAPPTVPPPDAR
ncbi:MAG: protein kinase [Phycisphaerae bacterium]|nr:protein kinase [Gemmatimonadaceae bacterium]